MRKTKKQNRWLALALCLCMLASVFPLSGMTYAAGTGCNHQHDESCGYVEAVEGAPCAHEGGKHDENCGYTEAIPAVPCDKGCAPGEDGEITHGADCAYKEAVVGTPCKHEQGDHDESCGYVEAVAGAPCDHVHDDRCGGLSAVLPGRGNVLAANGDPDIVASGNCGENGGDNMQWSLGTNGVLAISGHGDMEAYYYTGDGQSPWSGYRAQITTIIVEAGVRTIGTYAFYKCTSLTSATLSEGLQLINTGAFDSCTSLASVTFPKSLQDIVDVAFSSCSSLNTLTFLGDAPPTIGSYVFNGVPPIGTVYYPAGAGDAYTKDDWKSGVGLSNWTLIEQVAAFVPVTDIAMTNADTVAKGTNLPLTATITPDNATNQTIVWRVTEANGTGATITGSDFRATAAGTATIEAAIENGAAQDSAYTKAFTITVTEAEPKYHPTDVAVIQGIIANSSLKNDPAWDPNKPDSWPTSSLVGPRVEWTDGATNKRIKELRIYDIGLTGELDVSGLTELLSLKCYNNSLTDLTLTGLTKLASLDCSRNSLTGKLDVSSLTRLEYLNCYNNSLTGELDVTGLTKLNQLDCYKNSLTGLNVSGLTELQNLNCFDNSLTRLDVSGLTRLNQLYCYNNPFQSLKLPGGETLTVNINPANSGTVMFSHVEYQNLIDDKSITLTATAKTGHTFGSWTGDGTSEGNPAERSLILDGDKSVTATYKKSIPDYNYQTLIDPATGLRVTASTVPGEGIRSEAILTVGAFAAHEAPEFGLGGCDQIAALRAQERSVVFLHNVELSVPDSEQDAFLGMLTIRILTPNIADGTVLTLIHCCNGDADVRELTVQNGYVEFETSSLSPMALFGGKQEQNGYTSNPGAICYELTVIDGEGGGWYLDGDTAQLKAVPPVDGAKFLRWELVEGYGEIANPAAPETEFTMNIEDTTVRAVFELPKNEEEIPSTSPQTGDRGIPFVLPLLVMAGGGLLIYRKHLLKKRRG